MKFFSCLRFRRAERLRCLFCLGNLIPAARVQADKTAVRWGGRRRRSKGNRGDHSGIFQGGGSDLVRERRAEKRLPGGTEKRGHGPRGEFQEQSLTGRVCCGRIYARAALCAEYILGLFKSGSISFPAPRSVWFFLIIHLVNFSEVAGK